MSYLVLARKWRPLGFNDLIGQESIIRVLTNSLEQGKIAHAYLFSGPRGVGKTSTARILAKALNCKNGPTPAPCGTCSFCASITDGSSMDVMEIDGASNNSVNDIRDLRERVKYVPSGGRYKVYIIDETHMLSDAAFNALLKTLEEPPPHVVFVLATTAPGKIPATVLSRCQHLPFRRIPGYKIKERLKNIANTEGISITDPALEMVARAADGSLRDSLTILDQISSFSSDINESEVSDLLGITDFGLLSQLSVALIEGKREDMITITSELAEKGADIRSFVRELIQFFRNLLVSSIVKDPGKILDIGTEEIDFIKNILKKTSEEQLTLILSELLSAEIDIKNSSSPRLAFEISLLKASFLKDMKPLKEIIENIETYITQGPDKITLPERKHLPEAGSDLQSEAHDVSPDEEHEEELSLETDMPQISDSSSEEKTLTVEIWDRAVKKMEPPLASKLSKADFKLSGDKLILTLHGGYSLFSDSIKKNSEIIERILTEELGTKIRLEVETAKKKTVRKKDLKAEVMADPAIKEVLELFDGRIVDVTPVKE
jgi:DNA polymerase-3 subunit gamma/tau